MANPTTWEPPFAKGVSPSTTNSNSNPSTWEPAFYTATQAPVQTPDDPSVAGAEAPANEDGFWASAAKGAGHTIADWERSGGQWIDRISALTSTDPEGKAYFQNDLKNLQSHQSEVNRQWEASQPSGMMGKAGRLVGGAAPSLAAAALVGPETLAGNVALGAGLGAADPTSTEDPSAAGNVGAGALGGGVAAGAGKALGAAKQALVGNQLSNTSRDMAEYLQSKGISLDLAQRTGSRMANWIKTVAEADATGSNVAAQEAQKKAINTAAMGMLGTDADELSPEALDKARESIRDMMRSSIDKTPGITLDRVPGLAESWTNKMSELAARAKTSITDPTEKQAFANTLDAVDESIDRTPAASGSNKAIFNTPDTDATISPAKYMDLRESIFDSIKRSGVAAKKIYGDLLETLDDSMQKSIPQNTWNDFQLGRDRTKMLYQVGRAVDPDGNLNISKLYNTVGKASNSEQFTFGQGNQTLVEFSRALKNVVKTTGPDSGTAKRNLVSRTITGGLGALGGVAGDSHDRMQGAELGGAAGALLGPIAAGKIIYRGAGKTATNGLGYLAGSKAGQLVNSLSKKFDSQQ